MAQAAPAPGRNLDAVVVTAKAPDVQVLPDRKVYSIGADLQSATGTAADVLNDIPSVEVDADGNVALRGDPHVTILIDGKPQAQVQGANAGLGLTQLSASDIQKVEVMTNPPPQYKAEGSAGVINIITRHHAKPGLTGALQASAGGHQRLNLSAGAAYASGPLSLTGEIGFRRDYRQRVVTDERAAADPSSGETVDSQESLHEHLRRNMPEAKAGFDYALNPRQSFGVSASHQEVTDSRGYEQWDQSATPTGAPLSATENLSQGHEWDQNTAEEAHFTQVLNHPGETLSLQFQRSGQHEREHYALTDLSDFPAAAPTYGDLGLSIDLIVTEASADYVLPLSHQSKLRAGYDFEEDQNRFDDTGDTIDPVTGEPIPNPSEISHFRYRQDIHTAYGSYETVRGPWTLTSGVRIEDTLVRTYELATAVTGSQQYLRVYPNLHLERQVSDDGTVTFSASRRINRPDPQALNPFVDHQDIYNLRQGNPDLLPEDIVSFEAGYERQHRNLDLAATAFLRLSRDAVTDVTTVVGPETLLTTKENLPSSRSAGVETSASGHLGPRISYAVTATTFYNEIDARPLGGTGLLSTVGVNLKAHVDYKPTSQDTLQAAFSRSDRRLTPQGYIGAIDLVNFGYRRQVTSRNSRWSSPFPTPSTARPTAATSSRPPFRTTTRATNWVRSCTAGSSTPLADRARPSRPASTTSPDPFAREPDAFARNRCER